MDGSISLNGCVRVMSMSMQRVHLTWLVSIIVAIDIKLVPAAYNLKEAN